MSFVGPRPLPISQIQKRRSASIAAIRGKARHYGAMAN